MALCILTLSCFVLNVCVLLFFQGGEDWNLWVEKELGWVAFQFFKTGGGCDIEKESPVPQDGDHYSSSHWFSNKQHYLSLPQDTFIASKFGGSNHRCGLG